MKNIIRYSCTENDWVRIEESHKDGDIYKFCARVWMFRKIFLLLIGTKGRLCSWAQTPILLVPKNSEKVLIFVCKKSNNVRKCQILQNVWAHLHVFCIVFYPLCVINKWLSLLKFRVLHIYAWDFVIFNCQIYASWCQCTYIFSSLKMFMERQSTRLQVILYRNKKYWV